MPASRHAEADSDGTAVNVLGIRSGLPIALHGTMTGFVRVIGLMAVLAATPADAQAPATGIKLGGPQGRGYVGPALVNDRNAPLRFAAETLSNGACAIRVGRSCARYAVTASSGELLLRAETDIRLPDHGRYYVRYDFGGGALLARELATEDLVLYDDQGNTQGSVSAVAYRGAIGDDKVVFQLGSGGFPGGAEIHLDLSGPPATKTPTTATNCGPGSPCGRLPPSRRTPPRLPCTQPSPVR